MNDIHLFIDSLSRRGVPRGELQAVRRTNREGGILRNLGSPIILVAFLCFGRAQGGSADAFRDVHQAVQGSGADGLQVTAPAVEMDFCQLRPRYEVYFTKVDFTATFSFEVGADGAPKNFVDRTHITREDALSWGWPEKFVGPGTPTSKWMLWQADEEFSLVCISSWRLRGIPAGTKIVAEFKWKHDFGWESLHIVGEGINYTIKASGLRRNY